MQRFFRRETFIALRARRQGYRIARDFAAPQMRPPIEPLQPKSDYVVEQFEREQRSEARRLERIKEYNKIDWPALIFLGAVVLAGFLFIFYMRMGGFLP